MPKTRLLALFAACLILASCKPKPPVMPSFPPPPAAATIPCRSVSLPIPLTAEALEVWLIEDAKADAACEGKRSTLVEAWPR